MEERTQVKVNCKNDINMQILTWKGYDHDGQYTITFCGVTDDGKSIGVSVRDFYPYFYVKIPNNWFEAHITTFKSFCESKLIHDFDGGLKIIREGKRKILYPFTDNKNFRFLKLEFYEWAAMKKVYYAIRRKVTYGLLKKQKLDVYEANIDPLLRFGHISEINMAGWVKLKGEGFVQSNELTKCQMNVKMKQTKFIEPFESMEIAPIVIASFDIECDSKATRTRNAHLYPQEKAKCRPVFPDFKNRDDQVKIICTTFKVFNTDTVLRHAIVWGETDDPDSADIVVRCNSERELFEQWIEMVKDYDPDILTGYNLFGFDDNYMWYRMTTFYKMDTEIQELSRIKNVEVILKDAQLITAAYGTQYFKIFDIPGIYKIDLYVYMKREEKLDSYKLDKVAEHFLGLNKIDLPPLDLFYYMNGTPQQMSQCVEYCVQDTILPIRILEHRKILINLIQMANITRVPIEWLITKGQQIKVFSQLTYECRKDNILVPTLDDKKEPEKFVGATVLPPISGYYRQGVSGLDFASLYPSIMIANNLCYSTYIPESDYNKYKDRKDLVIQTLAWDEAPDAAQSLYEGMKMTELRALLEKKGLDMSGNKKVTLVDRLIEDPNRELASYKFYFVENVEGILPRILNKLWTSRKQAKKEMKKAKNDNDNNLADVLNGKQLAIKVTMNSVYGFTGATNGYMPMKIIASCVTARGRQLIDQTKSYCEKHYDCEVVYGDTDSCYVKFNLSMDDPDYMEKLFKLSIQAASEVTAQFKKPIELEFEKVMMPLLLFKKKRYACLIWTNPKTSDYVDCKGIQVVRRDSCPYVKEVSNKLLDNIMYKNDVAAAIKVAEDSVEELLENKVDPIKLCLSKTLRDGYKCSRCHEDKCKCEEGPRCNLPHVQLVKKMKERNAVEISQTGDRVPFFFREGVGQQWERVEHPMYLNKHNPEGLFCKPDPLYYLEHQLRSPLETLLGLLMEDTRDVFENGKQGDKIEELKEVQKVRQKEHRLMLKELKKDAE